MRALELLGGVHTSLFDINLQPILGFPGRVIDAVQFVNSVVIVTLLILAVPLYFCSARRASGARPLRLQQGRAAGP